MERIHVNEEELVLLPERAAWRERARTLLVADLHLGKGALFRKFGIPVPEATGADLDRLGAVIDRLGAERLVILGDLFHSAFGRSREVMDALCAWRGARRGLEVVLVRGNHDAHAGDPPEELGITCVDGPMADGRFAYRHEPGEDGDAYVLCGHVHPAVRMVGLGGATERARCFWFGERVGVLPAFGSFTGMRTVKPRRGDRVFVVGEGEVVEVMG